MFFANWCHLYNLKNVKNTHGGELLLVKLQTFKIGMDNLTSDVTKKDALKI